MSPQLEAEILASSQPLRLPGAGERRVLTPMAVERIAAGASVPRWEVEATALEGGVFPLHYLRNLDDFGVEGQVRLLRAAVTLVGSGPAVERAAELVALSGVGRIRFLVPVGPGDPSEPALEAAGRAADAARNRNASTAVEIAAVALKSGNPRTAVAGAQAVAACIEDAMEEQLLQFACRMEQVPLVLAGAEESRGQATTVLPGDAGIALVYKPSHPHLAPSRGGVRVEPKAALMVGAWMAEQLTRLVTGEGELLRGRLLFADLQTAEITEYTL